VVTLFNELKSIVTQKSTKTILQNFGLTDKQADVYLFLVKRSIAAGGEISKQTKIDRSVIYRILKSLQAKGLVEQTLESPIRFMAVPVDKALDLIIKAKQEEIKAVEKAKKDLIEDLEAIRKTRTEPTIEKFMIIKGKKKIYKKIQQIIKETRSQFYGAFPVSGLVRAEQFGVFDAAYNHPLKTQIKFQLITELDEKNLKAIKILRPKLEDILILKARNPAQSFMPLPRMVMRDEKEVFFFTQPDPEPFSIKKSEICIYTNCESLVQTYLGIFREMWNNSTNIDQTISLIETGKYPKKDTFELGKTIQKEAETLQSGLHPFYPITEERSVIAEIEALQELEKDILECAAVIGEEFSPELIEQTIGINHIKLLKKLDDIEQKHKLIIFSGTKYAFSRKVVREVLYRNIAPRLKTEYHTLIARNLEEIYASNLEEIERELSQHYYQSGSAEKSLPLLLKEARKAWNPSDHTFRILEAINYYSQALEMMEKTKKFTEEDKTLAFEKLGELYSIIGQHDKSNLFFEKGIANTSDGAIQERLQNKIRQKVTVKKDGKRTTYSLYGKGDQTILFVGESLHFMTQVHHFAQKYKVAVMNLSEAFEENRRPAEYTMESYVKSLNTIIDNLDSNSIYLMGAALGGTIALHVIAKHNKKVAKLALLATPPKPAFADSPERKRKLDKFWVSAFQSPSWGWNKLKEMIIGAHTGIVDRSQSSLYSARKLIEQVPPEMNLINFKIFLEADNRPLLSKIKIPTLILHGEGNFEIIPLRDFEFMNKRIKGSKRYVFKNSKWVSLTEIDKFNRVLEEFLTEGQVPKD
jgi:sugar-specific transcriptional regulator TrmB/pimeloyl-ACP methyl ester carboxylesterase